MSFGHRRRTPPSFGNRAPDFALACALRASPDLNPSEVRSASVGGGVSIWALVMRAQYMAGVRRPLHLAARAARGADQARHAVDRQNGRPPAGAVPGAAADATAAAATVTRLKFRAGKIPDDVG
jgi:hypothetical protein